MTFGQLIDNRIFKTNYVIYTDIENEYVGDMGGIVGIAIKRFDKIIGSLSLTASEWFSKTHKRDVMYQGYDYQISRIYEVSGDIEKPIDHIFTIGGGSKINLPAENLNFDALDNNLLKNLFSSRDNIYKKSLKYLVDGERALHMGIPIDKAFLDLFKSIEVVINSLSKKRSFNSRLSICSKKIGLSSEEQEKIKKLWKARSNGDIAHSKPFSSSEYLPPQYPVPSDADLSYFSPDLPASVLLKYFHYKNGEIVIITGGDSVDHADNGEFIDVNIGSYYIYKPFPNETKNITNVLKKKISENFNIKTKNVVLRVKNKSKKEFIFKIKYQ
jgi:hypothetical protein